MGRFFCLIFFLLFIFLLPQNVFAASLILESDKTRLNSPEEEYEATVTLNISVSNGTMYYLRGVFSKPDASSYCGYTWNGNTWFSGPYSSNEGWKNFLPITVNENTWTGTLKARIDSTHNTCKDSGEYNFKIQRFTASTGAGSFDDQNIQTILIIIPTLTVTPTKVPTPTKTPTPTKAPTPTKIPTPIKVPTSTKVPTVTKSDSSIKSAQSVIKNPTTAISKSDSYINEDSDLTDETASIDAIPTSIFGASVSAHPTIASQKKKQVLIKDAQQNNSFTGFAIIVGSACLIGSGVYMFFKIRKSQREE